MQIFKASQNYKPAVACSNVLAMPLQAFLETKKNKRFVFPTRLPKIICPALETSLFQTV